MSQSEAWLVLSFGILVVATLANLYDKLERLERRLERLEAGRALAEDDAGARGIRPVAAEALRGRPPC